MKQYLDLAKETLEKGVKKKDRTGTGTISIFGYQMRFDLSDGFPLLTTKRVPFRLVASELLWFLKGQTNVRELLLENNHIWDEWGFEKWIESEEYKNSNMPNMYNFGIRKQYDENFDKLYQKQLSIYQKKVLTDDDFANKYGDLGSIYGKQWRSLEYIDRKPDGTLNFMEIDQLQEVISEIKTNPDSRRLLVSSWNVGDYYNRKMKLPPCHVMFQFNVTEGKLNCQLYQRSCDILLGCPFNIASYSLLIHIIAHLSNLKVGEFIHTIGDAHIYLNHLNQINTQLKREPRSLPKLKIVKNFKSLDELTLDSFVVENYDPHPPIKAPVSV